jgi:cytochrome c-type biogenesis protein CcmF
MTDRIHLFRGPLSASLSRLAHLPRAAIAMTVAHAALGITVLGITGSAAWQTERILIMSQGDTTEVAGYALTLDKVAQVPGPNYMAERATVRVAAGSKTIATLFPERRRFTNPPQITTEAAIRTTLLADLYVVLGDRQDPGTGGAAKPGWTVRIYHNPLVPWIWIGAVIMVLGGLVSLTDRRHRVGAPARAQAPGRPRPA